MEAPFPAVSVDDEVRAAVELLAGERQALTVTEGGRPVGIVTRTARDCAYVLSTIAGHDAHDSTSSTEAVDDYAEGIEDGVKGLAFIEAAVASSRANAAWTRLDI